MEDDSAVCVPACKASEREVEVECALLIDRHGMSFQPQLWTSDPVEET